MLPVSDAVLSSLQVLWSYMRLQQPIEKADCLLVLGCSDLGVATTACELFHQGYAAKVLFSGGHGKITTALWQQTEAEVFARIALQAGIPQSAILLEKQSTNTAENVLNSMAMLQQLGMCELRLILVCKPYFERRAWATFRHHWPDIKAQVTSQTVSLVDYLAAVEDAQGTINLMVGDFQRIIEYPQRGWQISQPVPKSVLAAWQHLVAAGYVQQLL